MYCDYEYIKNNLKGGYSIGKSVFGRDILGLKFGSGGVLIQGGMHAREHITSLLVIKMAEYNLKYRVLDKVTFIPAVNPDGVNLSIYGLDSVPYESREYLTRINKGKDFELWKANGRGVDLNLNFDADWGLGLGNKRIAGSSGYIGERPFSEIETLALRDETNKANYDMTFSFHAKGEEIYYGYKNKDVDPTLTQIVGEAVGYPLKTTPLSTGGYKDWCVMVKNIPAYTIEFGRESSSYIGLYEDSELLADRCIKLLKTVAQYAKRKN